MSELQDTTQIEITEFTDPVCTWCWGSEPLLRKLEMRYGDQVRLKFIMGGLVKDINQFYDSYNRIGGDPEETNRQVARHWLEASERHGMPVKTDGFKMFSKEHTSTYPQNIAYKAAQFESEELANRFLRRMREASAAEALQTNRTEVLIQLASEVGLNVPQFIEKFSGGAAEAAFQADLRTTRSRGVIGFPTFLVKYGEKELLLRGYQSYETFKSVIGSLAGDAIKDSVPEKSEEGVLDFIKKYGRVAPVEIQASFDYSGAEMEALLETLLAKKEITKIPAGNGYFVELASRPTSCNPDKGICGV